MTLVKMGLTATGITGAAAGAGKLIEDALTKRPVKKAGGGMMKKKGYAKGGAARKGKPRGVGAALRGYGRALR